MAPRFYGHLTFLLLEAKTFSYLGVLRELVFNSAVGLFGLLESTSERSDTLFIQLPSTHSFQLLYWKFCTFYFIISIFHVS